MHRRRPRGLSRTTLWEINNQATFHRHPSDVSSGSSLLFHLWKSSTILFCLLDGASRPDISWCGGQNQQVKLDVCLYQYHLRKIKPFDVDLLQAFIRGRDQNESKFCMVILNIIVCLYLFLHLKSKAKIWQNNWYSSISNTNQPLPTAPSCTIQIHRSRRCQML